jgi:UDP:flavonoid glycosyltransferase YjiC (YdhE family)
VRHHFLHPVQVASALEKTPELSVFFTPDLIPTAQRPPTGFPALGSFVNRALWRVAGWGINTVFAGSAQALRRAKGLAPSKGTLTDTWIGSRGVLVAVSPALWSRPEDWPQTVHLTGFWRGPASEAPMAPNVEQFLSSGPPPLYASFGSHFPAEKQARDDTAQLLIEAARRSGHRLILQQPDERESGARSGHEADVLQVPYSPHALVFPRCAAVIHHGGAGTTQTALQAGVPAIIVPHLADQFFWASHLEQLSVAVAAPARREVRPDTLASSIQRAVGVPDIAVHARKLGAILRQEDGLTAACEAIELALRPCP